MADPVSNTRLYLGNLHRDATKENVREFFEQHGTNAEIKEVKIMSGFGFIEYADEADARDVVPEYHGKDFLGQRLTVQFARGSRPRDAQGERPNAPRPRRTQYRMNISGLPAGTSWQDLKDFARKSGCEVVYSETNRGGDTAFVEFESATDLGTAVEKLNGETFKEHMVSCKPDIQDTIPSSGPPRHGRSRSPRRGPYGAGFEDYRYGPPRPREYYARERSPIPYRRDDYYGRAPRYEDPYARGPRYEHHPYDRPPRYDAYEERYPPRPYSGRPPPHEERGRTPPPRPDYEYRSAQPRTW